MNTLTSRAYTLPVVILYVTEGCNLQCITCSYRQAAPNELTFSEIEQLAHSLFRFGLRHIVFSGGEPLLRRDFPKICRVFKNLGVKQSLLTNGLLLEKRLKELDGLFSEMIVSVDGPDAGTHNAIRGVASFDQIIRGIRLASQSTDQSLSIRMVIQKKNFRRIMDMVELAKDLHVNRLSFLTADVLSESFGRDKSGPVVPNESIILDQHETAEFRVIVEKMIEKYAPDIESRFISESKEKLFRLVEYFEALIGKTDFPKNTCNAPMVSAVITSTGNIQPCYFLPEYGNVRATAIPQLSNHEHIRDLRKRVKEYSLDRCQTCVCTLSILPRTALLDRF